MDKAVVLGSRKLFEKLCKNRLTGKVREGLKKQRKGTLISIDSKSDRENRLTRLEDLAEGLKTGELLSYQTISLHHLLGLSQNSKDYTKFLEQPHERVKG